MKMQPADFYPQAFILNGDEIILTADVLTLSGTVQESMAPYYIGYVNFDNMPTLWKMHTISIDSNTIIVDDIVENYGWGFNYHWNDMDGSGLAYMRPCFIIESGGSKTDLYGGYSHHFVNHAIIASASFNNAYRLCFTYIAMPTDWIKEDDSSIGSVWAGHYNELRTIQIDVTYEQIYDFLENDGTFALSNLYYDTRNNNVTVSKNDFGEETHTAKMISAETPGYTVFIQITNLYAYGIQAYIRNDNTKTNSRFAPFFAMSIKGNGAEVADQKAMVCPNHLCQESGALLNVYFDGVQSDAQQILSISVESSNKIKAGNTYMGNFKIFNGLSQQDFRERGRQDRSYYWYGDGGVIQGKILVQATNQLFCRVVCPLEMEDLRRIVCFTSNKNEIAVTSSSPSLANFTGSRGYTTDYTTALFDKDTSNPLEMRIAANFADIADRLCLWQYPYTDMAVNKFAEDDIPEYTPPEPESGEDWDGDRILPPVISGIGDLNGFITMYGMKPSQVAALGNYLWAKFTDATFWESISAVLDNTASIDPSVILNYVVSIRAYPFDLSDVAGTTHELPLVYFGRGLIGIPVEASPTSLSLRVLHKCVDSFAGGDLAVPAKYGDFRDMEPCAKLLLHVPFCGSCEINPSQVVGKHLFLRYTIDFATGGMMAICYTSDSAGEMAYPVAELHGHVGASVQLTGSNELDALQSLAGVGSGIASLMMGNPAGLLSGVVGAASSLASNRAVPHSTGKASGFSAYFQPRVPYIEIVYDQYYKPSNYAHTHGNACQAVKTIGSLHGYTVCKNVDTSGLTCEGDERIVIKRIMESGFYVD